MGKKSRKMKSTFTILIAVLAIVSVSSKVLFPGDFSAKNDQLVVTDEPPTEPPTDGTTEDGTTEDGTTIAPTEAPITTGAASISVTTFLVLLSAISMKL